MYIVFSSSFFASNFAAMREMVSRKGAKYRRCKEYFLVPRYTNFFLIHYNPCFII
jgi:hypothetical protein